MAKSGTERQREFRQRVNASALAAAQAELAVALERCEELEARLEQATSRHAGTCQQCGTALACPQCQGGEYA